MTDASSHRSVHVDRTDRGAYTARNARGGEIRMSTGSDESFTPVELLLAAIGGCSAVDIDVVTTRRSEPEEFSVRVDAAKVSEEGGSILRDIAVTFSIRFPAGDQGDAAREVLPRAAQVSHDRSCTVSRTVEAGVPVAFRLDG
jgi:putative redox protein